MSKIDIKVYEDFLGVEYNIENAVDWKKYSSGETIVGSLNPENTNETTDQSSITSSNRCIYTLFIENVNTPITNIPPAEVWTSRLFTGIIFSSDANSNTDYKDYRISTELFNLLNQQITSYFLKNNIDQYSTQYGYFKYLLPFFNTDVRFVLEVSCSNEGEQDWRSGGLLWERVYSDYFRLNAPPEPAITQTPTTTPTPTQTQTQTATPRPTESAQIVFIGDPDDILTCKSEPPRAVPKIFIDDTNIDYRTRIGTPVEPSPSCRPGDQPIAVIALAHSPTPPPTKTPTATPTLTPTVTSTSTLTPTPTITSTATPTFTPSTTATVTPSTTVQTPTPTATQTSTPFSTSTPTASQTSTPAVTTTPTHSVTCTPTLTTTSTTTPSPTPTRGCIEGESFDALPLTTELSWTNMAYNESRFLIMDNEGTYLYSDNEFLFSSTASSMPITGPELWNDLTHHNNKFIAIGKDNVATSEDGVNWNLSQGLPSSENTTYKWNKILYVEELGQKYFLLPTVENQLNNSPAPLAYSNDLNNWESVNLPVVYTSGVQNRSRNYISGAYGNGIFVLGSDSKEKEPNLTNRYNPTILSSFNGITWTPRPIGDVIYSYEDSFNKLGDVQDIYYNGNEFVAMVVGTRDENNSAIDCARIYHSYNGINWNLSLTIDANTFSMGYGTTNVLNSGKYLIIANNFFTDISTIYYSLDGLSWITIGQISTNLGINKLKAIGDKFYAVNNQNFYISIICDIGFSF